MEDNITQTQNTKQETNQKAKISPDPAQVTLDAMAIEKGDYQTGSEKIDTEEENTDYIHPIDQKTRQSSIPLGYKKK
jgi:hypothetical protein